MSSYQYPAPTNVKADFNCITGSALIRWTSPSPRPPAWMIFVNGFQATTFSDQGLDTITIRDGGSQFPTTNWEAGQTYWIQMACGVRQPSNNNVGQASEKSSGDYMPVIKNIRISVTTENGNVNTAILVIGQYNNLVAWMQTYGGGATLSVVNETYACSDSNAQSIQTFIQSNANTPPPPPPPPPPTTCPAGQHLSNGVCVPDIIPPPPVAQCVMYTVNFCDGLSQGFTSTQAVYDQLKSSTYQCNVTFSPSFPAASCDGSETYTQIVDIIHQHYTLPPPPPATNYLVIISTQCGSKRTVMTPTEYTHWQQLNTSGTLCTGTSMPCSLTYTTEGQVFEASNYSTIIAEIAACYNSVPPPPPPSGTGKLGLIGLTMGLLALLFIGDRKRKKRAH